MSVPYTKLSFQQIEIFLTVAKYESISTAAKELYITQPAVSRAIVSIEETLGIILFVRHRQRIHLTEAGKFLFKKFSKVHSEVNHIIEEAYTIQQNQIRHVSLADTNVLPNTLYLLPIAKTFQEENPSVSLSLERIDPYLGLRNFFDGKYDAYIMHTSGRSIIKKAGFNYYQFFTSCPCVALSAKHPLYHEPEPDLAELFKTTVAVVRDEYGLDAQYTIDVVQSANLQIDSIKYVSNMDTIGAFIATGNYIALGNEGFLSKDVPDCRYVEVKNCNVASGMGIAWSPNNENPYLHKLIDVCKNFLSPDKS